MPYPSAAPRTEAIWLPSASPAFLSPSVSPSFSSRLILLLPALRTKLPSGFGIFTSHRIAPCRDSGAFILPSDPRTRVISSPVNVSGTFPSMVTVAALPFMAAVSNLSITFSPITASCSASGFEFAKICLPAVSRITSRIPSCCDGITAAVSSMFPVEESFFSSSAAG